MAQRRIILSRDALGPRYTRAGENEVTLENRAVCFDVNWERFMERGEEALAPPERMTDARAWEEALRFFQDRKKVDWAMEMHVMGLDLLCCTELEVKTFITDCMLSPEGTRSVRRKGTLNNYISEIREMFRMIGREHSYGDGVVIRNLGEDLVFTGNPMTTATERAAERVLAGQMEGVEQDPEKHGPPVSVVVSYVCMVHFLTKLMSLVVGWENGRIKQVARIENLAMLVMIYAFLLHEACRPGDITGHLLHEHLFLPLHAKVYWMTLVFLKPKTLGWLLRKNIFDRLCAGLYKGKDKKFVLYREKAPMPVAFNSLDMMVIYVICMRVIVAVSPGSLGKMVFKKGLFLQSLRSRQTRGTAFAENTLYSNRYGAARDDKVGKINPDWTRQRMGHSEASNEKDEYASHDDRRGSGLPLGMDLYRRATNPGVIKLEMKVVNAEGVVYDTEWMDRVFAGDTKKIANMRKDFEKVSGLVSRWIEEDDACAMEALLKRAEKHDEGWYGLVPLGFHTRLPGRMLAELKEGYERDVDELAGLFREVEQPKAVPELWSFPQVTYGNWRGLLEMDEEVPEEEERGEGEDVEVVPGAGGEEGKKKRKERVAPKPVEKQAEVGEGWDGETFDALEVDNVVAINTTMAGDRAALPVPGLPGRYVWLARMVSLEIGRGAKTAKFTGHFYTNRGRDITRPLKARAVAETITIQETSLVEVYQLEDGEEEGNFSLTEEQLEEMVEFMRAH